MNIGDISYYHVMPMVIGFPCLYGIYKYLKHKGIYISDFFTFKKKTPEALKQLDERIKTFGVRSPDVVVSMRFKNNFSVPCEKIEKRFQFIKKEYCSGSSSLSYSMGLMYYWVSSDVFRSRYSTIIHNIASEHRSELKNKNTLDQIFIELERRLIIKTIERDIISRVWTNMKSTLSKSMKPILKMSSNFYKTLVEDIVINVDTLNTEFKVTKAISLMLVHEISGSVAHVFSSEICRIYRSELTSTLSKRIEKNFELDIEEAENKIASFVQKFSIELDIFLEKQLKTIFLGILVKELGKIKRVPKYD